MSFLGKAILASAGRYPPVTQTDCRMFMAAVSVARSHPAPLRVIGGAVQWALLRLESSRAQQSIEPKPLERLPVLLPVMSNAKNSNIEKKLLSRGR